MKYFLKTESINNIKTLACTLGNQSQTPFATVSYYQTDSNSAEYHLEFQVLKIAFFGTLGAPVNKEMS